MIYCLFKRTAQENATALWFNIQDWLDPAREGLNNTLTLHSVTPHSEKERERASTAGGGEFALHVFKPLSPLSFSLTRSAMCGCHVTCRCRKRERGNTVDYRENKHWAWRKRDKALGAKTDQRSVTDLYVGECIKKTMLCTLTCLPSLHVHKSKCPHI